MPGPVHAADQEDVLPAIVVVVQEGAAAAQRFREQAASVGAAVVAEVEAGCRGDVDEAEARRGRLRGQTAREQRGREPGGAQLPEEVPAVHSTFTRPLRRA